MVGYFNTNLGFQTDDMYFRGYQNYCERITGFCWELEEWELI